MFRFFFFTAITRDKKARLRWRASIVRFDARRARFRFFFLFIFARQGDGAAKTECGQLCTNIESRRALPRHLDNHFVVMPLKSWLFGSLFFLRVSKGARCIYICTSIIYIFFFEVRWREIKRSTVRNILLSSQFWLWYTYVLFFEFWNSHTYLETSCLKKKLKKFGSSDYSFFSGYLLMDTKHIHIISRLSEFAHR